MPKRVDIGPVLAALGALLLFVSLFLEWFGARSGWAVFELLDLVLAGAAIVALLAAVATAIGGSGDGWGDARWLPALGLLALVAVAAQLLEPPPGASGERGAGAWLALAGAALLLLGGLLETAAISVSVQVREGRASRRRVSAVDRRVPDAAAPPTPPRGGPRGRDDDPVDEPPARVPAVDRRAGAGSPFGAGAVRADDDERTEPLPAQERPGP